VKDFIEKIKKQFPVTDEKFQKEGLAFITIEIDKAVSLITYLRDYEKYTHLTLLTAVDWLEEGVFQLTYLLNSPELKRDLGVRVMVPRDNPVMTSAHHLWEQMPTYQRELKEMFGIDFPGSPRLDEDFILEGWDNIPPYRRDFDTKKYSEETYFPREGRFTHDPEEYMKEKLYPEKEGN
jgi:NADH-quinone oxidoreductase subunit C